jgi:hypothetical protein
MGLVFTVIWASYKQLRNPGRARACEEALKSFQRNLGFACLGYLSNRKGESELWFW